MYLRLRITTTSLFWYSLSPNKIKHLPDVHHKYSTTGVAAIGGKVLWSFPNLPAEDRPNACPKQGTSPQASIQCSSRVGTLLIQSACTADVYTSLCFLAKPHKSVGVSATFKIFSAYSQNTNARNNVQLEGIGRKCAFCLRKCFLK